MKKTLREVCDELAISRRSIQGYEKMGLVAPAGRNPYGHLLYDEAGQKRIQTIRFYQQIGFSRKEIQGLLDAPNTVQKAALQSKACELEIKRQQLQQLIEQIEVLIAAL